MPSKHLIPSFPSPAFSIRVFSSESVLIRWPKYCSFSFSISPSNEYSGLISFRMDWLDLLAVQGALKSLLQHHSSEASILQHSAFFLVQLWHPFMTTRKTIGLTRQTFVGKVMSQCVYICKSCEGLSMFVSVRWGYWRRQSEASVILWMSLHLEGILHTGGNPWWKEQKLCSSGDWYLILGSFFPQ